MTNKSLKFNLLLLFFALFFSANLSAEVSDAVGKQLFKNNCASCHNKDMKSDMTGPALGGVRERWEGREEVLYAWIRNSQAVISEGDEYAVNLFNKWNKSVMTAFPTLTDDEVESLLVYIDCMYDGSCDPKAKALAAAGGGAVGAKAEQTSNTPMYLVLLLILGILAVVMMRIVSNLNYMSQVREGNAPVRRATLTEMLTSRGVIGFVLFALIVLGGYTTINNAIDLNRQQGYAPDQPIKFSHATHAGMQKIDCQYCHDGARRSKHSVIPAANTCMNCHKAIEKGSKYGTAELTKIFASIGYNPDDNTYIKDYESMSNEDISKIYKKWIEDNYKADNAEASDKEIAKAVTEQWDGIVSSLTTDVKESVAGPIPWVRIHNLPDHAYFSHQQHVTVGKVECQTCHGPVEEMDVAYQHAPLSMGWCINCHRKTEVQFVGNEYYESYKKYHEEIKAGTRDKVTVEEIGGLECQKCHY